MIANHFPLVRVYVQVEEAESSPLSSWRKTPNSPPPEQQQQQQQQSIMNGRVTLQRRTMGSHQPIRDATVYILHLNGSASGGSGTATTTRLERIRSEIRQLVDVLRVNSSATLALTGLIPDPGSVGARAEARARLRDMTLFQLTNQQDNEVGEILAMLSGMSDNTGRLILVNKNCSPRSGDLALELRYQPFTA
jgi:hypothetical protein